MLTLLSFLAILIKWYDYASPFFREITSKFVNPTMNDIYGQKKKSMNDLFKKKKKNHVCNSFSKVKSDF